MQPSSVLPSGHYSSPFENPSWNYFHAAHCSRRTCEPSSPLFPTTCRMTANVSAITPAACMPTKFAAEVALPGPPLASNPLTDARDLSAALRGNEAQSRSAVPQKNACLHLKIHRLDIAIVHGTWVFDTAQGRHFFLEILLLRSVRLIYRLACSVLSGR